MSEYVTCIKRNIDSEDPLHFRQVLRPIFYMTQEFLNKSMLWYSSAMPHSCGYSLEVPH